VPAGGYADDVEYAEGEWVANAETGEMEWHAADGSVMSQAEWVEQIGGGPAAAVDVAAVDVKGDGAASDPIAGAAAPEVSETPEGDGAPK
jgi:N utilization substance protein A